jgi:hypothetical protein
VHTRDIPDEVEPDDPSFGGQELLGKSDGDRARDPHGLGRGKRVINLADSVLTGMRLP